MRIESGGAELFEWLPPLWEALYDHHESVGAAGLATIPREESWPLRRAHYERIFAGSPWARIWLVRAEGVSDERGGADTPVGYGLAFEDEVDGRRAVVIETLSLLPAARGSGIGAELMRLAAEAAVDRGVELGVIDVMGGNLRARELYLRNGYLPHSETWMRSRPPATSAGSSAAAPVEAETPAAAEAPTVLGLDDAALVERAAAAGFRLSFLAGPDDSWVSSDRLAELVPSDAERGRLAEELETLFGALEGSGSWTILVEIPVPPAASSLREALVATGFNLSMERVVRELAG